MSFGTPTGLPSEYYYGEETTTSTGGTSYQPAQTSGLTAAAPPSTLTSQTPAPTPSAAPTPPPSNPQWVFAVNLPSTYPDYAAMKASGSGLVVVADDPNADILIAGARQWGIPVSIQVNAASGITPEQYAQRVADAKARWNPDKLVLDIEDVGKGYQGSEGWNWSQQAASLLQGAVGGTSVAITMPPTQDDYNYGAYKGLGGNTEYWVQSYLGDMTPVDPNAARQTLINNGVDPNSITVITAPGQTPSGGLQWASYGLATQTSSSGVYGATSNQPYYPGQQPVAGAGSGQTPGPPIYVNPNGPYGGGQNTPPAGTPGVNGTTTAAAGEDWASTYFGNLGLPPDVVKQVDEIFRKYDPTVASQLALAYIRGTPWYAQTFPGIKEGIQKGVINDERDYRAYVNAVDQSFFRNFGRHVSASEVGSYMYEGLSPDTVSRQFEGLANVMANSQDYRYYLGAFGTGADQNPSTDDLRALGEQSAGLSSAVGMRVQRALQQAVSRYQSVFAGQLSTPSLSLTKGGLSAPSLATNTNDIGK